MLPTPAGLIVRMRWAPCAWRRVMKSPRLNFLTEADLVGQMPAHSYSRGSAKIAASI
jgi:hypothetical protein